MMRPTAGHVMATAVATVPVVDAVDGVVDVVDELTFEQDDTAPEFRRYWR